MVPAKHGCKLFRDFFFPFSSQGFPIPGYDGSFSANKEKGHGGGGRQPQNPSSSTTSHKHSPRSLAPSSFFLLLYAVTLPAHRYIKWRLWPKWLAVSGRTRHNQIAGNDSDWALSGRNWWCGVTLCSAEILISNHLWNRRQMTPIGSPKAAELGMPNCWVAVRVPAGRRTLPKPSEKKQIFISHTVDRRDYGGKLTELRRTRAEKFAINKRRSVRMS